MFFPLPRYSRTFGEAEHVGLLGVLGAAAAFGRREGAFGVDLAFEAGEELVAGGLGAGAAVGGLGPRDVRRDLLVDVGRGDTSCRPVRRARGRRTGRSW
jgi:hypothetical protein